MPMLEIMTIREQDFDRQGGLSPMVIQFCEPLRDHQRSSARNQNTKH